MGKYSFYPIGTGGKRPSSPFIALKDRFRLLK